MVWKSNFGSEEVDGALIFDLRQIYAKDILGETLKAIKLARINDNYNLWYHLLKRDLLTEISQKLNDEEIEHVRNKIQDTKNVIEKYKTAFVKKNTNPNDHEQIEDALCNLEMCMTRLMEDHKMYGYKEDDEGL
jgi:hypothetical protein